MAKHAKSFRSQGIRNLKSAGYSAARFTGRTTGKAAAGLFRCATTDYSGMGGAISRMPKMGLWDSLRYIFTLFMIHVLYAITGGIWIFLLIAYGIPYLIYGHF